MDGAHLRGRLCARIRRALRRLSAASGTWFADLPLVLAALPFTLIMRRLNGGSYDFAGDMTARVAAAVLFCCALAYLAGLLLETLTRAVFRFARGASSGQTKTATKRQSAR